MTAKKTIYTYGPATVQFKRSRGAVAPGTEAQDIAAGRALAKLLYSRAPQGVLQGFMEIITKLESSDE